jgi:hypothetical protein
MKGLVLFLKINDDVLDRVVVHLKEEDDPRFIAAQHMMSRDMKPDQLHRSFLVNGIEKVPEIYLDCLRLYEDKLIFDNSQIIETNFDYWLADRAMILNDLDVEFIRSVEKNDEHLKSRIILQKEFLRDLPNFVLKKLSEQLKVKFAYNHRNEDGEGTGIVDSFDVLTVSQQTNYRQMFNSKYTRSQVLKFTPYFNILFIDVLDGGSGYEKEPSLEFECNYEMAFPPKYKCILKDKKLKSVEIITGGCGYTEDLKITVSPPDDPNGKRAKVSTKILLEVPIEYSPF